MTLVAKLRQCTLRARRCLRRFRVELVAAIEVDERQGEDGSSDCVAKESRYEGRADVPTDAEGSALHHTFRDQEDRGDDVFVGA